MEWSEGLRLATPYISLALGLLLAWVAWSFQRKFVTREDYEADRAKLREAQSALAREHEAVLAGQVALQKAIGNLPTAKDMYTITLSISEMRGDMKALGEKMDGQAALQTRMEQQLGLLMRGHMRTEP